MFDDLSIVDYRKRLLITLNENKQKRKDFEQSFAQKFEGQYFVFREVSSDFECYEDGIVIYRLINGKFHEMFSTFDQVQYGDLELNLELREELAAQWLKDRKIKTINSTHGLPDFYANSLLNLRVNVNSYVEEDLSGDDSVFYSGMEPIERNDDFGNYACFNLEFIIDKLKI